MPGAPGAATLSARGAALSACRAAAVARSAVFAFPAGAAVRGCRPIDGAPRIHLPGVAAARFGRVPAASIQATRETAGAHASVGTPERPVTDLGCVAGDEPSPEESRDEDA